jgi:hypothetical protein
MSKLKTFGILPKPKSKCSSLYSCRWCLALLIAHPQTHNDGVMLLGNTGKSEKIDGASKE